MARTRILLPLLAACGAPDRAPPPPPPAFSAVTFNVAGGDAIADPVRGQAIADELAALAPDVVALQECVGCDALVDKLPDGYALAPGGEGSEIGLLYAAADWEVADTGTLVLGDNDDGWGRREARWAELVHLESGGVVDVYSTHFCVSIRSPDDACDVDRQLEYARAIVDDIAERDAAVVLGGDFNVFEDFETGPVIRYFVEQGLVDTLRAVSDAPVVTFEGNTWAPAGRIDYVFARAPVAVDTAGVAGESASDHRPVHATLAF